MKTGYNTGAGPLETERDAVSVLELREGGNDLRALDLLATQPAQRVGDDPRLGTELRLVAQMLELAAATGVEVRASGGATVGADLDEL